MTEPGIVQGEHVRLLQCFDCKTMEELPDYPPDANRDNDVVLHTVHEKHGGKTQMPHACALHRVPKALYSDPAGKRQLVKKAWEGVTGFTPSYYDIKNTLMEDAVKCHVAHHRQVPCLDYRDGSKRLRSPSQGDRDRLAKDLSGAARNSIDVDMIKHGAPQKWLCDFCPVQVAVEHAQRVQRGEA